jgi:uncharacterized protein YciI
VKIKQERFVLFVAICTDKPGSQEVRLCNRAAHLDYLRLNAEYIKTCGPFVADDGITMNGSMLVVEAENREAVKVILARDPYQSAGLFATVDIRPWRWVVGSPLS